MERNKCDYIIERILVKPFSTRSFEEKNLIIKNGKPMAALTGMKTKTKQCTRSFQMDAYKRHPWLAGCDETNRLYILFSVLTFFR
jgi:hypothetical protein